MDELARTYVETHDKEIIEELYKLARVLGEMGKREKKNKSTGGSQNP